jgi:hypothetical protein
MEEAFQHALGLRIGEHPLPHALAVHRPADDEFGAEKLPDRGDRAAAFLGQRMRDRVGIHDARSQLREFVGRGALPAADPAREADHETHSRCTYQRTIGSPQNIATMPASAR